MNKLYKIFGYLGALPFIIFAGLTFVQQSVFEQGVVAIIGAAQFFYGAMIINFLSGIHWVNAFKTQNKIRLSLAMLPTIMCLILGAIFLESLSPILPLAIMAAMFALMYLVDKRYHSQDDWPEGYLSFRLRITSIVTVTLLIHAGYLYVL